MTPEDRLEVQFTITSDEAIVLFEFLQRFSNTDKLVIEDQAEERALWNLCCVFETNLAMPFDKDYPDFLREARERLRDEP
ncbi:hypothetical protein GO003_024440 [Methylicorpusculum oleiharenae]|uniref:hypothetical protein n=1 Tax=Methylicorpusculum oleiharenae TaxID=1338687 RepID=UPI00135CD5A1|nr:hypothetical protein [Methylicorpusculum oleiharenae]MCD2453532.1 hypothetical protein [Methylicorpusculum oleiharenae]